MRQIIYIPDLELSYYNKFYAVDKHVLVAKEITKPIYNRIICKELSIDIDNDELFHNINNIKDLLKNKESEVDFLHIKMKSHFLWGTLINNIWHKSFYKDKVISLTVPLNDLDMVIMI